MLNCCPVCYSVADSGNGSGSKFKSDDLPKGRTLHQTFFHLFHNYLNENVRLKVKDKDDSSPFPLEQLAQTGMVSCESCRKEMDEFCQLYNQLKKTELLLNWKVEKIKCLMERKSTLINYVLKSINDLEDVSEYHKKGVTQTIDSLQKSKKTLVEKCCRKLKVSFPRVRIAKLQQPRKKLQVRPQEKRKSEIQLHPTKIKDGAKKIRSDGDVNSDPSKDPSCNRDRNEENNLDETDIMVIEVLPPSPAPELNLNQEDLEEGEITPEVEEESDPPELNLSDYQRLLVRVSNGFRSTRLSHTVHRSVKTPHRSAHNNSERRSTSSSTNQLKHGCHASYSSRKNYKSLSKNKMHTCSCRHCKQGFYSVENFRIHLESQHLRKYECDLCEERFRRPVDLANHQVEVHPVIRHT